MWLSSGESGGVRVRRSRHCDTFSAGSGVRVASRKARRICCDALGAGDAYMRGSVYAVISPVCQSQV